MIETWWGVLLILFMVSFLKLVVDLFCIFKWFHYLDLLLHHFLLNVVSIVQGFKPIWHICWVPHVLWCLPVIRWVGVISRHVFDLSWAQMLMCSLFSGITTCEVQLVLKPRTIKQKLNSYVLQQENVLLWIRPMCRKDWCIKSVYMEGSTDPLL